MPWYDDSMHLTAGHPNISQSIIRRYRIVAIPACNEAVHIATCLKALAAQQAIRPHAVVIWINNSTDGTLQCVEALAPRLPFTVHVRTVDYAVSEASAGRARRDAMACAASLAPEDALLFTTDADGAVAPDWMRRTLAAFARYKVGAVFGRALLFPHEASSIPAHLQADDDAEQAYAAALERISAQLAPDWHDPWPRHAEHSGASIAVTRTAWAAVGGIPDVASSEDRAFYQALRQGGFPARHAPDVFVYVSARVVGRARGGMAETIARRLIAQDPFIDDALETVAERMRRIRRHVIGMTVHPPIRRADLPRHHARALRVLARLQRMRDAASMSSAEQAGPDDTMPFVPRDHAAIHAPGTP